MAEQRNDPVISVAGNVGRPPQTRQAGDRDILEFSLAVPAGRGYGDEAGTIWYDVTVWNPDLQASVKRELSKGSKVAVEGFFTIREHNGATYNKLSAVRVGVVEWLQRSKSSAAPAAAPGTPAAAVLGAPTIAPQITENDW